MFFQDEKILTFCNSETFPIPTKKDSQETVSQSKKTKFFRLLIFNYLF